MLKRIYIDVEINHNQEPYEITLIDLDTNVKYIFPFHGNYHEFYKIEHVFFSKKAFVFCSKDKLRILNFLFPFINFNPLTINIDVIPTETLGSLEDFNDE